MKIQIDSDFKKITKALGNAKRKIIYVITEQATKDSNFYIPKRDGDLELSSKTHSDYEKGIIGWSTPYARKLYYNPQYNFKKDVNPHARGLWFEHAKSKHLSEWINMAKKEWYK